MTGKREETSPTEGRERGATLRPCPFCGDKDLILRQLEGGESEAIQCDACGVQGPPMMIGGDTIEAWNSRPNHDRLTEENRRLREALKPFAAFAENLPMSGKPFDTSIIFSFDRTEMTVQDVKRAKEALRTEGGE